MAREPPNDAGAPHYRASRSYSVTHTSLGRTPLEELTARRRNLSLQQMTLRKDRHPCSRRDSNPEYRQASSRTPTRPLGFLARRILSVASQ